MKVIITSLLIAFSTIAIAQVDTKPNMGYTGESEDNYRNLLFKRYDLKGRRLLNNPFTDSVSNFSARIVLNISVDSVGNVIDAFGPAKLSTSSDKDLINRAKKAALTAKFSRTDSLAIQKGKLVFTFHEKPYVR